MTNSFYRSIVPEGYFQVTATEKENLISKTVFFSVFNETDFSIIFDLVVFHPFLIESPRLPNEIMNITYSIKNDYIQLNDVSFVLTFKNGNQTIKQSVEQKNRFDKGSFTGNFTIETQWISSNYSLTGEIYVSDALYSERIEYIALSMPLVDDILNNPVFATFLPVIALVTFGMIMQFVITRSKMYGDLKKYIKVTSRIISYLC